MSKDVSMGSEEGDEPGMEGLFGSQPVNCDEAVHQLYHYLDGELTDERRIQISEHLTFC
jgi:hypothetical protein